MYRTNYCIIEENTATNGNNAYGMWAKASTSFVTIRGNNLTNITNGGITVHYSDAAGIQPHSHEVCYNKVVFTERGNNRLTLLFVGDNLTDINRNHYDSFIYRNAFVNGSVWVRNRGTEDFEVYGNIVVSDLLSRWNTPFMDESWPNGINSGVTSNLVRTISGNDLVDASGNLTGAARTQYLGTHGHEISANSP